MRLSLACGVLPLLAVAVGATSKQDQKVTFTSEARPANEVIADLAAKTGLKIETTDDAKKHVLIVSVTDVPEKDLIERIAKAMSSSATFDNGTWTIAPDEPLRKKEQADVVAGRIKSFRQTQEEVRKLLSAKPDPGLPLITPLGSADSKALANLVLMINPIDVGTLSPGGRIVFSTSPNRMQRPMRGPQVAEIFQTLFSEHNAEVDEQAKSEQGGDAGMADAFGGLLGKRLKPRKFEEVPSKAVLVLESKSGRAGLGLQSEVADLKVYDAKGQVVVMSELNLSPEYFKVLNQAAEGKKPVDPEAAQEKAKKSEDPTDTPKVELSKRSQAFVASAASEDLNFNVTPELKGFMEDPVKYDPLSFVTTDVLFAIAKVKNLDVVANMPDNALMESGGFIFGDSKDLTVGLAMQQLTSSDALTVTNEGGWLTVVPKDPADARNVRQDRAELKTLISGIEKNGSLSLEALANFASKSPAPMENLSTLPYFLVFAPSAFIGSINGQMDWDMLRFYASLEPPVRRNLRDGQRVPFSSLSGRARNILTEMSFGANANIVAAEDLTKPKDDSPWFLSVLGAMAGGQEQSYIQEPTEVMPNGLPNGYIEMSTSTGPVLQQTSQQRNIFLSMTAMTPQDFAFIEMAKEAAPGFNLGFVGGADAAKIAQRETLDFHFWLSDAAGLDKSLFDDHLDPNAKEISMTNLPADFRALVDKAKEKIKNSPLGKLFQQGGGGGGAGGGGDGGGAG
ncbi:MAG TPA: hypothetical protein VNI20_10745 [Fimbriimonadaceae bacterium]|nr:hypothetical protein [Fimbriimonadaceae bacterium]